jgi:hypothetical protein
MPSADRFGGWVFPEQPVERPDHAPDRSTRTTRIRRRIDEHETMMPFAPLVCRIDERDEVSHVLGYDGSPLFLGDGEQCGVGEGAVLRPLRHGNDIVAAAAKLLCDDIGIHLI